jgi:glycolate oxidase
MRLIDELKKIVGETRILADEESLEKYSHDFTEDLRYKPTVAIIPDSARQTSGIMKLETREKIPVTPRGAGTGLSGGALPVHGGIVLSLEKMNRILEIDENNLMAVVESGIRSGRNLESVKNTSVKRLLEFRAELREKRRQCLNGPIRISEKIRAAEELQLKPFF